MVQTLTLALEAAASGNAGIGAMVGLLPVLPGLAGLAFESAKTSAVLKPNNKTPSNKTFSKPKFTPNHPALILFFARRQSIFC